MSSDEDNLLNISGIQHFVFCRRQWALIHIEQQWEENVLTISGEIMHKNAHDTQFSEKRKNLIISRGMPVISASLGLTGVCDVVEFHKDEDGAILRGYEGTYKVIPVEYKCGKPKNDDSDILQVAAQAMCLEEMFCTQIDEVHIYYGKTRHRIKIPFDGEIRERVEQISKEMHQLYSRRHTPKVKPKRCCSSCSLKEVCLPKLNKITSVKNYINRTVEEI
ncbi:MAG: CRISPR-associated protein Cas4 [Ruminococcus sp.]|nr:CRISPR-associated protein Cas4 [Ruminococcus sp.]